MGLSRGKSYNAKKIQDGLEACDLTVTSLSIKALGSGNCTLVINGHQVSGSYSDDGGKLTWGGNIQDKIKDVFGGNTINWTHS